ncbi:MAG: hypothetical protein BA863_08935 [Desulfovibrio sp. S3730MH75]|nr:MAG: hypothetical protein BA863_08935 [Desulfovibrio sp. S3730MH75]
MMKIKISRYESSSHGTFGHLIGPGIKLHVIELPWRDNRSNLSCIPPGEYHCTVVRSPRFGVVYHVKEVPGRSHVLIHAGNYAGDSTLGYRTHSHGCILPGRKRGRLGNQKAILCSKAALTSFMSALERQPFILTIEEVY